MKLSEIRQQQHPWVDDEQGNVNMSASATSLRGCPRIVEGHFNCSDTHITTLKGGPEIVGGYYSCSRTHITDLVGAPRECKAFFCAFTDLTSLHNVHKHIKQLGGGQFHFNHRKLLTNILGLCLIKGICGITSGSHTVDRMFAKTYPDINLFQEELIEAGFIEQAKL